MSSARVKDDAEKALSWEEKRREGLALNLEERESGRERGREFMVWSGIERNGVVVVVVGVAIQIVGN